MTYEFFKDDGLNFEVQNLLGGIHCGCGDAGEILATISSIGDGDLNAWVVAWQATADRVAAIADTAAARGHRISARDAYLRAATYYATVLSAVDGVDDPDAALHTAFTAHRRCFDAYVALLDIAGEHVAIPYEDITLPGYFFSVTADSTPRPTLILVNGSDGPITWVWPGVGRDAYARGYNVLAFDGPGQQSMLFEHDVAFRHDWEHVITPVVDFLRQRPDVDKDRIAIYGGSQAGYWVPRALAFEHRIAAAIVDPGVVDVSTSWTTHLPPEMVKMLDDGDRDEFDQMMSFGTAGSSVQEQQIVAWRSRPYGINDPFDLFKAVEQYRLGDLTQQITTPVFVADPEDEQFWPGQAELLYEALPGSKTLVKFTATEGADRHCEPMARTLFKQRAFDWLDDTMSRS